jgi:hypothetical protein
VLIRSETDNLEGWVKAGNIDKAAAALNEAEGTPKPLKPKANVKPKPKPQAGAATAR